MRHRWHRYVYGFEDDFDDDYDRPSIDRLAFRLVDPYKLGEPWAIENDAHDLCVAVLINDRDILPIVECYEAETTYPKDPVELCDYGHSDPKNLLVELEFGLPLKIGCGSGNGVIDEPLTVHVTEEKNTVTWDLTGNDLTEAAELTFTFDKNRYYIAIQKLKEKIAKAGL